MDVTPLVAEGRQIIEGYGEGSFRVSGVVHVGPVIIFPENCYKWTGLDFETSPVGGLENAFQTKFQPTILIVGTGKTSIFLSELVRNKIRTQGAILDVMNTGAACRTFNVLLSEDRQVAAALMPVD